MKNIVWQQPGGAIAVHNLPDDADSQAAAAQLLSSGAVAADWVAVLFDVVEFPEPPQEAWRFVGGILTFDQPYQAAWLKASEIEKVLATLGRGKDRTLIQQVVSFAELVAAPALAAQYGVSLELAVMGLYARNKTYRYCKDCETACAAIEAAP